MNRRVLIASVWLLASACGTPNPQSDVNTQDAAQDATSTGLFMNRYHPATDVTGTMSVTTSLSNLETAAEADQWDTVETGTAAGTAANSLLSRIDMEFIGGGVSSQYSNTSGVQLGIMLGRAATTEAEHDVAHETVAKTFAVVRGLATVSELRSALSQMTAGNATMARAAWDRAAAYFASLEPLVREYQTQTVMNVWGPGRNAIATDNIADTFVDMLVRGATAIDANNVRGVIEAGNEADLYLSHIYVSMSAKYAASLEDATVAMTTVDPGWHPEGQYSLEGVIDPYLGLVPDVAAVSGPRGHWRNMPYMIARATHLRDLGGIYARANSALLDTFAMATDNDRYATIARFRGTVGALKDAFTANGQDPAQLLAQVDTARMHVEASDAAGALTALQMVQTAVSNLANGTH